MSKLNLIPNRQHLENAANAKRGIKAEVPVYKEIKEIKFRLEQNENGEWYLQFDGSENRFPATDVEIVLWKKLKQLETVLWRKLKQLEEKYEHCNCARQPAGDCAKSK